MSTSSGGILSRSAKSYVDEVAAGNISGHSAVNKFGTAYDADQDIPTDLWSRANIVDVQPLWVPPTVARIHTIVSDNAGDIAGGAGARLIRVWYIPDGWNLVEAFEDVVPGAAMVNATQIINRMKIIDYGLSGPNIGKINAVAAVDSTTTAQILNGRGQTQAAIFGIPSIQKLMLNIPRISTLRASLSTTEAHADWTLLVNERPDVYPDVWIEKDTSGSGTRASNPSEINYVPPKVINGPAIIKLQVVASTNNLKISGGFDGVLRPI